MAVPAPFVARAAGTPRFEVWPHARETRTATGQRYVVYGEIWRFAGRADAERAARLHEGLVLDVDTGEVYRPLAEEPKHA